MRKLRSFVTLLVAVAVVATPVLADWDEGDGDKMHYPQLPDPNGWDVAATLTDPGANQILRHVADDWTCSESGPVLDLHFWGSWKGGVVGVIDHFEISIHADDPVGVGGYFDDNLYSTPLYRDDEGNLGELWYQGFYTGEYTSRLYGNGDQGWYDPNDGTSITSDHAEYYQYNIDIPLNAATFHQEKDTVYWLMIQAVMDPANNPPGAEWGWKTSMSDHHLDDAVFFDDHILVPQGYDHEGLQMPNYVELYDPTSGTSLDMAFVITPEPGTLSLLGLGCVAVLRRRKK